MSLSSNTTSNTITRQTGFRRLATVPQAARLRSEAELVDAHMYYYDLTSYRYVSLVCACKYVCFAWIVSRPTGMCVFVLARMDGWMDDRWMDGWVDG